MRKSFGSNEKLSGAPAGTRVFRPDNLTSQRPAQGTDVRSFEFEGRSFVTGKGTFKTDLRGLKNLAAKKRLIALGNTLCYVRFLDDFPVFPLTALWEDTGISGFGDPKIYVVQTLSKVIERCILMTTDPGDLALDPTCGSGTTAYVAEQWGRRWITSDTSRIALNIAKTRVATATYPWYSLYDPNGEDVRQGFRYTKVQHVTLKSLANDEPPEEETLYNQPEIDKNKLRITGPFTVETLQSFEPTPPEAIESGEAEAEGLQRFTERVFAHLQAAGIKNGIRNENAVFTRINPLAHEALHAEGFYTTARGEAKAYLHIGPQFGMVSRQSVNEAIKEWRLRGDADWLVIMR